MAASVMSAAVFKQGTEQKASSFRTYEKFSEKLTFLTPDTYACVSRGYKFLFFLNILRTCYVKYVK